MKKNSNLRLIRFKQKAGEEETVHFGLFRVFYKNSGAVDFYHPAPLHTEKFYDLNELQEEILECLKAFKRPILKSEDFK